jgi:hypothetical protein
VEVKRAEDEPIGSDAKDKREERRPLATRKMNERRKRLLTACKMGAGRRKSKEAWGLGWGICEILLNVFSLLIPISCKNGAGRGSAGRSNAFGAVRYLFSTRSGTKGVPNRVQLEYK